MTDAQRMVTAVLAGYAWDRNNAIVREPARMLRLLDELTSARGPAAPHRDDAVPMPAAATS